MTLTQSARQHRQMWWLGVVGVLVTAAGSVAAVLAVPGKQPDVRVEGRMETPPGTSTGGPRATVYVSTLRPETGASNLVALPRSLRNDPTYARAIAIRCPSNNSSDRMREITYSLRGRYLDFTARIEPFFATEPDSRVHVFAVAGRVERDGTLTRRQVGEQLDATGRAGAPLSAPVDGAAQLTLRVKCETPDGIVIVSDGHMTPAL